MRAPIAILAVSAATACSDRRLVDEVEDGGADEDEAGEAGGAACSYDPGAGEVVIMHAEPVLAVDETGSIVVDACRAYWTMQTGEIGGEVYAMPNTGGQAERLAADLTFVHALALSDAHLFFADQRGVHRTPIDASAAATLVMPYDEYPIDVAADGDWVYVATPSGLLRMPVEGGDAQWIHSEAASLVTLDGERILLRTADALVAIDAATFDATTLATVSGEVWDVAVGEDAIYLAKGDRITFVPKDGGAEQTWAAGGAKISTLAVDGTHAYWTDFGLWTVHAGELATAEVVALAEGVLPVGVAIDERSVFWTTTQPARVSRRAKP